MQMQSPFGIKILNAILTDSFNSSIIELVLPESNNDDVFINDCVISLTQTDEFGIQYCQRAAPQETIRGIVVGFEAEHLYENRIYRKGGIRRKVRVCEDPFLYCKAQVNDILLDTDIGRTMNIDSAGGNTVTGTSSVQLDYSTIANEGRQFKVQKILKRVDTSSDPYFPEKYTLVECIINLHEFVGSTGVVSTGLWDRVSNYLIPHITTDSVHVGSGLRDNDVTTPILIGDTSNTTFDTINQTIIGAVNELFGTTGAGFAVEDLLPVTFDGEAVFTLSESPTSDAAFRLYLNGQLRLNTVDYIRSDKTVTWLNPGAPPLTLKTTDVLLANYNSASSPPLLPSAREEKLTVTFDGRTAFSVSYSPVSDAAFALYLNGQLREFNVDYSRSDKNITWLDPGGVTLETVDNLTARYNDVGGLSSTTRELWMIGTDYNSNIGNYRSRVITGTGTNRFTFHIPDDFVSLVKLKLVGIVSVAAAGASKNIDLTSDYGTVGQAYNFYSESDTTTLYDFTGKGNQLVEVIDLSIVMSNIAAGQYCGVLVDHNSIGGSIYYLGIELVYNVV